MKGIVYILTNPAMPGIVKIGLTTRGDLKQRLNELYTTGVPVPFDCVFACDVDNCEAVERALHIAFGPYRVNPKREFFKIEPEQPLAILKLFEKKEVTQEVNRELDATSTEIDRQASEKLKKQRRPPLDFHMMGIPNGSVLHFEGDDKGTTAEVIANKKVQFNGRETSLTQLTTELMGLDYAIQPTGYWSFNGKSLLDIYNEVYLTDQ
jgi:T5orf172 domain